MARGPKLRLVDEQEVKRIFWLDPTQKAEAVRNKAEASLKREFGLSTVQRILVPEREKHRLQRQERRPRKEIDQPWSIGSTVKFPVPPNGIRLLLTMQQGIMNGIMTIRQALWNVRLTEHFWEEIRETSESNKVDWLAWMSILLASFERASEDAGVPCDTSRFDDLDMAVMKDRLLEWLREQDGVSDEVKRGIQRVLGETDVQATAGLREALSEKAKEHRRYRDAG